MSFLDMRVVDIEFDQLAAVLNGLIRAEWPVSGDDIARHNNQ